ncbi:MAG: UDP-N-acetylglucosamine 1-carboxyvinyltransferase [Succinivibrionaceae bacterium]|nr:UDP-N-acetylglucosamine 1-carboxyvinyltransferase [Ruminobacter sp.]MDY5778653.1 UDP-N-acetylglucosamine 1-carboxyvinyltransferase [Succinivibrionaceae bacterium]MEE1340467.1 UDP-N-acetylglucosamine 1-carboxyvinyltransferase [Succinivibrionaceae bacterium]
MQKFKIQGGKALIGDVTISGAKNAALPIIFATILTDEPVVLHNVPNLKDVDTSFKLLEIFGKKVNKLNESSYEILGSVSNYIAPYDLVKTMRASILALGPLSAKMRAADVSLPGGCAIGARPVNLHIDGLTQMGAQINIDKGYIKSRAPEGLKGNFINLDIISVTGSENLIAAATLAHGETVIQNVAKEPEVQDLIFFLNSMGAKIEGAGTSEVKISGVEKLHGTEYSIQPDRIETGTFLVAAVVSHGCITCHKTEPKNMFSVIAKLEECGAKVEYGEDWIKLDMRDRVIKPVNITTAPYPAFPTDMQAQFTLLNAVAQGTGVVTETIFENRFMHVPELNRMGANIELQGNSAICGDCEELCGAEVMATDLRASASLVIAGLIAKGETIVDRIYHMDRGYENIELKFRGLGGNIERIS